MLKSNAFVVVISKDSYKAFNTVRHSYVTMFASDMSENVGVVQGSVVGPASYVFGASDLQPVHPFNILVKYTDDSYLLVGFSCLDTVTDELTHITGWAKENNVCLNTSKTREMIITVKGQMGPDIPLSIWALSEQPSCRCSESSSDRT